MKLIDFKVNRRGFLIEYHKEGTIECKDDKYWLYFVDKKLRRN